MAIFMPSFSQIDVEAGIDSKGRLYPIFGPIGVGDLVVDLATMTIPLANDRSTALNQSVANEFRVVQASNDKVGQLNNAMQELQRISPTGVADNKQANVDVPGFNFDPDVTLSKQSYETLLATKDAGGSSVMGLFSYSVNANGSATITKMADGKTFAQVTNTMKSAVDQASQNNQLEMTTLQGLTNKYNQSIETMSDLVSKFNDLNAKLAGNFRPLR